MKNYIMYFTMLLIVCGTVNMNAQVTIGSLKTPSAGALLDLTQGKGLDANSDKGLLFPRVNLEQNDELAPLYEVTNAGTKKEAIGMIVYNLKEDNTKGLSKGLLVWNGEEWQPMNSSNSAQATIGNVQLKEIIIEGAYTKDAILRPAFNIAIVTVEVLKKGSYVIELRALMGGGANEGASNGYSFYGSGEFTQAGTMQITLAGQGKPLHASSEVGTEETPIPDNLACYLNSIVYTSTDPDNIPPTIIVNTVPPQYSFNCGNISVQGVYSRGTALTDENYITMRVSSSEAGGKWQASTNMMNGIRFEGSGTLAVGSNLLTLYGTGTPIKGGSSDYTITTNSTISSATCNATVSVPIDNFNVGIWGTWFLEDLYWNSSSGRSTIRAIFENTKYFGTEGIALVNRVQEPTRLLASSSTSIDPYDCIFHIYGSDIISNATFRSNLVAFVKSGRLAVITIDHGSNFSNNRTGMQTFLDALDVSAASGLTFSSTANAGNDANHTIQKGAPVVGGPFMDLSGRYMRVDGGDNGSFSLSGNALNNWWVIGGTNNMAVLIMHKQYPLILALDGGMFGGTSGAATSRHSNGVPSVYNSSYNAHLMLNILLYAAELKANK